MGMEFGHQEYFGIDLTSDMMEELFGKKLGASFYSFLTGIVHESYLSLLHYSSDETTNSQSFIMGKEIGSSYGSSCSWTMSLKDLLELMDENEFQRPGLLSTWIEQWKIDLESIIPENISEYCSAEELASFKEALDTTPIEKWPNLERIWCQTWG